MSRPAGCLSLLALWLFVGFFAVLASSLLPWWAIGFGMLFWILVARRRRLGPPEAPVEGAAAFSPFRGGGY